MIDKQQPTPRAIDKIYHDTLNQNTTILALTSANLHEGVSTIAALLSRAATTYNKKILLIDFNLANASLSNGFSERFEDKDDDMIVNLKANIHETENNKLFILPPPINSKHLANIKDVKQLKLLLTQLAKDYDHIIIDTESLTVEKRETIPSINICQAAQACVLVVLAARTTASDITDATEKLVYAGSNFIGVVMNDQYNPRLDDELCRETYRFEKLFPKLMKRVREKIKKSSLLTLDI